MLRQLGLLLFALWTGCWTAQPARAQAFPHTSWKAGDKWDVDVDYFPRADKRPAQDSTPAASRTYGLHITVTGTATAGGVPCYKVYYLFHVKDVPNHLTPFFQVHYDRKTCWPVQADHLVRGKPVPLQIESFGNASLVVGAPEFLPLDMFSSVEPPGSSLASRAAELTRRSVGSGQVVEVRLRRDKDDILLRQTWSPGEDWWRETEKHVNGRKEYHARRRLPPVRKSDPYRERAERLIAARYLRNDPELRVSLIIDGDNSPLPLILERLGDCTGLRFTLADNLKQHSPRIGSVQLGNAPAYIVMELVAKHEMENGRWMRVRDGYHLTGISKVPPNRDLVTFDDQAPVLDSREFWLLACGVALVSIALVLVLPKHLLARWLKTKGDSLKRDGKAGKPAKK